MCVLCACYVFAVCVLCACYVRAVCVLCVLCTCYVRAMCLCVFACMNFMCACLYVFVYALVCIRVSCLPLCSFSFCFVSLFICSLVRLRGCFYICV